MNLCSVCVVLIISMYIDWCFFFFYYLFRK
nr:MAG TPA: hypothetical protein [Microviridae sp.]